MSRVTVTARSLLSITVVSFFVFCEFCAVMRLLAVWKARCRCSNSSRNCDSKEINKKINGMKRTDSISSDPGEQAIGAELACRQLQRHWTHFHPPVFLIVATWRLHWIFAAIARL